MDIVLYPNPTLRAKNKDIEKFDDELKSIAQEMFETMYATKGVGLAAPQVGLNKKLLVFNASGDKERSEQEFVLCNPKIIQKSKKKELGDEGCLSFPEIYGSVNRHLSIKVQAQDLEGHAFDLEFEGWEARIFQHEFDHIDGILFIDRMTPTSKELIKHDLEYLRENLRPKNSCCDDNDCKNANS